MDILIPHYKEPDDVVRPLLHSISMQKGIDRVIMVNDGGIPLSDELIKTYDVEYHIHPHGGLSATRNALLDYATSDYIMYCDADDMFISQHRVKEPFDVFISVFLEEVRQGNRQMFVRHEHDGIFVHGKAYRRQFLLDNDIRWNNELTIFEDSYFNALCLNYAKDVQYCEIPFYLWKWREGSMVRRDLTGTFPLELKANLALCEELIRRGMREEADYYREQMIKDARTRNMDRGTAWDNFLEKSKWQKEKQKK